MRALILKAVMHYSGKDEMSQKNINVTFLILLLWLC